MLSNLGNALQARFERTGQQADLDQAITRLSEAVDAAPADHPDRPGYLSNLGAALQARFERTGQQADLDQAITRLSEAVDATPRRPPRPARDAVQPRGRAADPVRAHRAAGGPGPGHHPLSEAVDATPAGHPYRPALANLGAALQARFGRTGQQADLDQAITRLSEAVDATPADHPDRPDAVQPRDRAADPVRAHRAAGGPGPGHHRRREAVDATPADDPDRPGILSNLGAAL